MASVVKSFNVAKAWVTLPKIRVYTKPLLGQGLYVWALE